MSNKKNQTEVSQTSADLISAAKAGEPGNPGASEGTEIEPNQALSNSVPAVPMPNAEPTAPELNVLTPGQPEAPNIEVSGGMVKNSVADRAPEAPITPPVRQQSRASAFNLEEINQGAKTLPTDHLRAVKNVIDGELQTREPQRQQDTVVSMTYDGETIEAEKLGLKTTFTKAAWDQLPKNKKGWREIVKTPPEVEALKK